MLREVKNITRDHISSIIHHQTNETENKADKAEIVIISTRTATRGTNTDTRGIISDLLNFWFKESRFFE